MVYHSGGNHDPYGPDAHGPSAAPSAGGRSSGGVPDGVIVGGLGLAVSLTLLTWTSTGIAGWIEHGRWPAAVTFDRTAGAVRGFLTAPADINAAWPQADPAALPSAGLLWLVFFAQLVLVFAAGFWTVVRVGRWRRRARERRAASSESRPLAHGQGTDPGAWPGEPGPTTPPAPGADTAVPPHPVGEVSADTAVPPHPVGSESADTAAVPPPAVTPAAAVLRAPGGAVVIDPDGALFERTGRQRGRSGPVHVYDPGHRTGTPVRLRWAPHRGCEDAAAARARAVALLGPVRPRALALQLDAETAETLLRCYLHAAALDGAPFAQVRTWAQDGAVGGNEVVRVLRGHARAAPGMSMECEAALTSHEERRDAALALVTRALAGLARPEIQQTCTPGRADVLALDRLADGQGTLYVVGDGAVTEPFRQALLAAVDGSLHRVGPAPS